METVGRFLLDPEWSFFLLGPRGTGKSTWLRAAIPDAVFVDLLQPATLRDLAARPENLADIVQGAPGGRTRLDEVQRATELLPMVHHLIETRRRRFVLSGSSARKLRRGGADLLGGRALLRTMHPFMAGELPQFRLADALRHGMLPLVLAAPDPDSVLRSYAALYLEQEVRGEGLVRRIGDFARFLEVVTFSHASVLNVANIARECEIERKTVVGWLEVLDDLLLSFTIPVFTRRARRATTVHPKFYMFDAGVFRALRPTGPVDRPSEIERAALEGLVAQHLRAWIAYSRTDSKLYFWRTRAGAEVDFILYGDSGLWALQVQNSTKLRPADLTSLGAFGEDHPEARRILLYRGKDRLLRNDIHCIPVESLLAELRPDAPLLPSEAKRNPRLKRARTEGTRRR